MAAIITKKFRIHNSKQLIEAFSEAESDKIYLFIGKVSNWPDEATAPTPTDSVIVTDYSQWDDMIAAKRIGSTDVSHVIARKNWTTGTAYAQYDAEATNLYSTDFYVMNSNFYVYKVISNNNGANSTVEPIGSSTSVFETADGYLWKFMYEISGAKALKFITPAYIPVQTLSTSDGSSQWSVQTAAVDGSIENIDIINGGSGYNQVLSADVATSTNANTFNISVSASSASANTDFYVGASVYVNSGTGVGQLGTILSYTVTGNNGVIVLTENLNTSLIANDSTIKISPRVQIVSPYTVTPLTAYSVVTSGAISKIQILNNGASYVKATATIPIATAAVAAGAAGSNADIKPIISPIGGHGSDATLELGGWNIMLNSRLEYAESGDFTIANDFRKIGLLKNPLLSNSAIATAVTYDFSTTIEYNNTNSAFVVDEVITGATSGATATIVDVNSSDTELRIINVLGEFSNGETIQGGTSSAQDTITGITAPLLKKYSGDVLYVDNRTKIVRGFDQVEDIKLVIQF